MFYEGETHPFVALELNNLAVLLLATNRLAEAEPLMRRSLLILLQNLGPSHPDTQTLQYNYITLLQAMGRNAEQIRSALEDSGQRNGIDRGGAGEQGNAPSPKLHAVIEEIMRDQTKAQDIAAKLQREDPALFMELVQWIQSQRQ